MKGGSTTPGSPTLKVAQGVAPGVAPGRTSSTGATTARASAEPAFASPAATRLDELVQLQRLASVLARRRRRARTQLSGAAVSRRLGRGLDFAETRVYQPGDDVRMIDWRVTARTGLAHTKLFVEERERPVLFVVDYRAGMRFGTRCLFKSVLAARLAAVLGWSSVAERDRVGGFVVTDDWHAEVRPANGRRGLMKLFRAIDQAQQRLPEPGQGQFGDCLARLRHVAQPGSTVVILSDFADFDEQARGALGSLSHSLDLLAVQIVDPLERTLPPAGRYPVVHQAAGRTQHSIFQIGGRRQRQQHAERFQHEREAIVSFFARGGHKALLISTDQPLLDSAAQVLTRASPLDDASRAAPARARS